MKRILSVLLVFLFILFLPSCEKNNASLEAEDIRAICELATVNCYYNNVAKIDKKADNIFQKDRSMWIEFEGEAKIGVDMADVEIEVGKDTVEIKLPKAKIISIGIKEDTLNEKTQVKSSDRLLFKNEISTEEQNEAIEKGKSEMKKAIEENTALFKRAENNAKELIENYISELSKIIEKDYKVIWK